MARVTLAPEFSSISGKLCRKDKTVIALNKQTGKMYRYDDHGHKDKNSADQQAVRTTFTQKVRVAALFWKGQKPSTTNEDGTELYKSIMAAYKSQRKYGNPFSFVRSMVNDDLKIEFGGKIYTANGADVSLEA